MIKNDQQLGRAEAELERLQHAMFDPDLMPDQVPAVRSELARVTRNIQRYKAVRSGHVDDFTIEDLGDLADVLVLARVARGYTQQELADRLGTTQQQVAKDENGGYHAASLTRLSDVLDELDYDVVASIRPADRSDVRELWFSDDATTASRANSFRIIGVHPGPEAPTSVSHSQETRVEANLVNA